MTQLYKYISVSGYALLSMDTQPATFSATPAQIDDLHAAWPSPLTIVSAQGGFRERWKRWEAPWKSPLFGWYSKPFWQSVRVSFNRPFKKKNGAPWTSREYRDVLFFG